MKMILRHASLVDRSFDFTLSFQYSIHKMFLPCMIRASELTVDWKACSKSWGLGISSSIEWEDEMMVSLSGWDPDSTDPPRLILIDCLQNSDE